MGPREVRAIRGATTVTADDAGLVREATRELLLAIVDRNGLDPDDVISAVFTATPDIASAFPACAARELGWSDVPLLCASEIAVPGALPLCVRVLLHVTTAVPRSEIAHVYLRDAVALRPELAALR